jgi:hypothetical protein
MVNSSIYNELFSKTKSMKGGALKFDGQKLWNLIIQKKSFLILVFSNLIAQLGITYYVMNKSNNPQLGFWPLFALQLIIIWMLALVFELEKSRLYMDELAIKYNLYADNNLKKFVQLY